MQHTLIALVENKPGVLNRVASLFRRRNFNIESLNVGRTEDPAVSRMTIVMDSEALDAFKTLSLCEGIIPAYESSHALAYAVKLSAGLSKDKVIVVNLSGRGDKDIENK